VCHTTQQFSLFVAYISHAHLTRQSILKVLSLEDGKTYERSALTKRNLSRAAHERQAAAWVMAQSDAIDSLVDDASLSLVR